MSFEANIQNALDKIGQYYIVELKNGIQASGNVASKDLLNSIKPKVSADAVTITANRYLQALSEGKKHTSKRPSPEMVSSISRWMKFKGLKPKSGGLSDISYKKASFAIAKRINNSGWAGSKVIQKAFYAIEDKIDEEITNAFKQTIDEIIQEMNQEINKK